MIEQRPGREDAALWVREGERRLPGRDDGRRLTELRAGLLRHPGVRAMPASAGEEAVEAALGALHERAYLDALRGVREGETAVMTEFAPPGLEPDVPVSAGLVAAAREAVRTAITAAWRLAGGRRFTYAVCRPPGHHAGPDWLAGYCYLNSAAAAARTLRESGFESVGVLDLDLHYPNGTSALLERIPGTTLHSLHAAPVTNLPAGAVLPRVAGERTHAFAAAPGEEEYLAAVATSVAELSAGSEALVVSLGYDTVSGDPHGDWDLPPSVFAAVGGLLAAAERPVCVVQEGGYALDSLAECAHAFATGLLADRPAAPESAPSPDRARAPESPRASGSAQSLEAPPAPEALQGPLVFVAQRATKAKGPAGGGGLPSGRGPAGGGPELAGPERGVVAR